MMKIIFGICGLMALGCAFFVIKKDPLTIKKGMTDFGRRLALRRNRRPAQKQKPQDAFKKIQFKEEACDNINYVLVDGDNTIPDDPWQIGDNVMVRCDLYQSSGYSAKKVGFSSKKCCVTDLTGESGDVPLFECTVTDVISDQTWLHSAGLSKSFQEGTFATTGGVGLATGAKGKLDIKWVGLEKYYAHIYYIDAPFMKNSNGQW